MNSEMIHTPSSLDVTLDEVRRTGAGVIEGVFGPDEVARARQLIMDHADAMPNTRPYPGARHLAGFHRFPALEPLHRMLTGNPLVQAAMAGLCGGSYRTIGLSDITVDRSQQWHKDLLRGEFTRYLGEPPYCPAWHGTVFKVIAYLQDTRSLRIVPGSHRVDIDLANDAAAIPSTETATQAIAASLGDAVIIDICTTHCGSPESVFLEADKGAPPKILVSTVFGRSQAPLTDRLELGNAARMNHWTRRHQPAL